MHGGVSVGPSEAGAGNRERRVVGEQKVRHIDPIASGKARDGAGEAFGGIELEQSYWACSERRRSG